MKPAKTTFGCMCMCLLLEGALVLVGKPQETIPTWLEGFEDSAGGSWRIERSLALGYAVGQASKLQLRRWLRLSCHLQLRHTSTHVPVFVLVCQVL